MTAGMVKDKKGRSAGASPECQLSRVKEFGLSPQGNGKFFKCFSPGGGGILSNLEERKIPPWTPPQEGGGEALEAVVIIRADHVVSLCGSRPG